MAVELELANELDLKRFVAKRIGIVVSRYNNHITDKLAEGAIRTFEQAGFQSDSLLVARVPGAWELAYGTQKLLSDRDCVGVVALGAVIRGETTHDQHINRAVSMALMQLSLDYNKPVGFGLLTVNNLEQAIQRSGGNVGNKGEEAAGAVLECLKLSVALPGDLATGASG
jgi:6,7-dimethyl-8-ribityllumazine synthase